MRIPVVIVLALSSVALSTGTARAQFGRGAGDWVTSGGDAQRSSWIRTDPKISPANMQKPDFRFLWKVKLADGQSSNPVLINFYIGYRGFRSMAFVGGSSNDLHAVDTDLARIEWQNRFSAPQQDGAKNCGGTMTAVTRPATVAFPASVGGGPGRGGPARSGVGDPDEGAVTLKQAPIVRAAPADGGRAPGARGPGSRGPGAPAPPGGFGGFRMPSLLYALTMDGMLHSIYLSN